VNAAAPAALRPQQPNPAKVAPLSFSGAQTLLTDFVKHISTETGMSQKKARAALGIVLNAAERQGADLAAHIYREMPGARTLSARMGAEVGAATGVIARLIEQTPGGRKAVAEQMLRDLQKEGLGHTEIGSLFPAIGKFTESAFGLNGAGHLGDLIGTGQHSVSSVA
jgi:hypothetical protein